MQRHDADGERDTLCEFLDQYRGELLRLSDGLTDAQARTASVPPSDLNIMGLVRHMADVERYWFDECLLGGNTMPYYYGEAHPAGDPDGDHHPGPTDTMAEARQRLLAIVAIARATVQSRSLTDIAVGQRDGHPNGVSLRWILVHMIEEYARHCGHADLLRERIDHAGP